MHALCLWLALVTAGSQAAETLLNVFYTGHGTWRDCASRDCHAYNQDWGVDALTYATWLRWKTTGNAAMLVPLKALARTAPAYPEPCSGMPCSSWSDVPEWDAIAAMREYEALHDAVALEKAKKAFAFVDRANVFALGACSEIHYQLPMGDGNHLKTLETDANYIKAALLLYSATREPTYLDAAKREYAAVRKQFFDPQLNLYSVYVFDDGQHCSQVPHRFFASVNGDMIWSGIELANLSGDARYRGDAYATARAVDERLSDARGIFADMQAENDIVEPLVEAMWVLAKDEHQAFARSWILRNAGAALGARKDDGTFGRFFDGPTPRALTTAWQSNGGLALEIAADALGADDSTANTNNWHSAKHFTRSVTTMPATISFYGRGIALIGAIGAHCCEPGHARVFIDGLETNDGSGIWQNKSSSGRTLPNSVLLAWQWKTPAHHVITIQPGIPNAKEGGPFISLTGYDVIP